MKFVNETGAIISPNKQILHLVDGTAGLTMFPQELLWNLHKNNPGIVYALSHVHPPGMAGLSHEDETTLLAQALAMSPFPARMITITETANPNDYTILCLETCYFLRLEAKEEWQKDKTKKRKWEILKESEKYHRMFLDSDGEIQEEGMVEWYGNLLIQGSYK